MKALITGNLGYLGPLVVRQMKDAGIETVGLDTGWFLPTFDLTDHTDHLPDQQLFLDLRSDKQSMLPSNVDVVVHLAGLSNDPLSEIDDTLTKRINVIGTIRLMELYPDARHVVASSASVYGSTDKYHFSEEGDKTKPLTAYARAKVAVDEYIASLDRTSDEYDAICLRFGTLWGWSPNMRRDIVVNAFCWQAAKNREVAPAQNARRPMLHVKDAAHLVVAAATSRHHGIVNCATENTTVLEIADKVARATESALVPCPESNADARDYWLDTQRMSTTIGQGHPFTYLEHDKEIMRVFRTAQAMGDEYPTRIQRVKQIIEQDGRL